MNNISYNINFGYISYKNSLRKISEFDRAMLKDIGEMTWEKYSELQNKIKTEDENSAIKKYFYEEEFFTENEFKSYLPSSVKTIGEKSVRYLITFQ